ncbi:MAG: hypothetical protein R6V05_04375 [Candidatus Brocadiia bacterium]
MSARMALLLRQFGQVLDTLGIAGIFGLVYLAARGRRHVRVSRGLLLSVGLLLVAYAGVFTFFGRAEERYYRPVAPLLFIAAGGGFYALWRDLAGRRVLQGFMLSSLVLGCLLFGLHSPLRTHRRPQTEAGRWLRRYDPQYDGLVVSADSQPVYYAGRKLLPADQPRADMLRCLRTLRPTPYAPRYVILDGDDAEKYPWLARMVDGRRWKLIYWEPERGIRIYRRIRAPWRRRTAAR